MNRATAESIPLARDVGRSNASFGPPAAPRTWRRIVFCAAVLVTVAEALLLQRKSGLFTGGFLTDTPFHTWEDAAAFLLILLLMNATAVAPLSAIGLAIARGLRLGSTAGWLLAIAVGCAPIAIADFLSFELWRFLGDAFDFGLAYRLTGRHLSEMLAVSAPLLTRPIAVGLLAVAAVFALIGAVHRLERGRTPMIAAAGWRPVLASTLQLVLLSAATVTGVGLTSDTMRRGLLTTSLGTGWLHVLNGISDLDGDGYGVFLYPRDTAPFNAAVHPYALDIPGNAIDEDGVGGDLPIDQAVYTELPPPQGPWRARPPVLLFLLESFRADVVGASYDGRQVTPIMDGLSLRGLKVESAWSHNGFTTQSRFHTLTCSMIGRSGTSVLDDFKNHGYEVTYFSGQDDSAFGGTLLSRERIDHYFDARQELDKRYTAYTTAGSLAVPCSVVEQEIYKYLDNRKGTDPLFMYVNFQDTHYPYDHPGLLPIITNNPLPRSLISPSRRSDLWRTYLNAAANVDAAIGRVIAAVHHKLGVEPAVIVLSDHGESLFDRGFLGHGYVLNAPQTQIPMIVSGLPVRIDLPFGQAGLRDAIDDALSGTAPLDARPSIASTNGRVFQYLGSLAAPGQIGWLSNDGQITYDFRTNRVMFWESSLAPDALRGQPKEAFLDLVRTWERMRLAQAHAASGSPAR
jgi:hypothetical protein